MTTYSVGPIKLDFDDKRFWTIVTGAKMAVRTGLEPVDADRIPEGWRFPPYERERREWPTGLSHPTDFWVSIWREYSPEHINIQPDGKGWWVKYNPENSWTGGDLLGPKFETYERALEVAIDATERLNDGATRQELRYDYDENDE